MRVSYKKNSSEENLYRILLSKADFMVFFYIVISFVFFILVASPVLNEKMDFQFYADSKTYEAFALTETSADGLVKISSNYLGPFLILKLLGPKNYFLIFLFNLTLLLISIHIIRNHLKLGFEAFLLLLFISPFTFTSLFSVNKEIISLICMSLLISYIYKQALVKAILIIFLSYLVRWQLTVFVVLVLLLYPAFINTFKKKMIIFLCGLFVISFLLKLLSNTLFYDVFAVYELTGDSYTEGSGSFNTLMNIQAQQGYFLAFIPKSFHLWMGMISRYGLVFDFTDTYNNFIVFWQAPINMLTLWLLFKRKLFTFNNPFFYIIVLYFLVFAITPIYAIRYFYGVYILVIFLISNKEFRNTN